MHCFQCLVHGCRWLISRSTDTSWNHTRGPVRMHGSNWIRASIVLLLLRAAPQEAGSFQHGKRSLAAYADANWPNASNEQDEHQTQLKPSSLPDLSSPDGRTRTLTSRHDFRAHHRSTQHHISHCPVALTPFLDCPIASFQSTCRNSVISIPSIPHSASAYQRTVLGISGGVHCGIVHRHLW